MLEFLAPGEAKPFDVTVFSRAGSEHCARAQGMLQDSGIDFESLELNKVFTDRTVRPIIGATTVPQIFVNGELIGGAVELEAWLGKERDRAD
jgi:glutaredoxin